MTAAELAYLLANPGGATVYPGAGPAGAPLARVGQHGGEQAGLPGRQIRRANPEMVLRRRFGAKDADAPFDAVEVHLEDSLLRPEQFDQCREPGLDALAQPTAAGPEEQVLGHLLAQRAGATQRAALFVVRQGRTDRGDVEAPVFGELLILGGDHRHLQVVRQLAPGAPAALQVDAFAAGPGLHLALDHQRGERRRNPAQQQHQQRRQRNEPEQQLEKTAQQGSEHVAWSKPRRAGIIAASYSADR